MQNKGHKIIYTTISIDKETGDLVEKICKRYSRKNGEIKDIQYLPAGTDSHEKRKSGDLGGSAIVPELSPFN